VGETATRRAVPTDTVLLYLSRTNYQGLPTSPLIPLRLQRGKEEVVYCAALAKTKTGRWGGVTCRMWKDYNNAMSNTDLIIRKEQEKDYRDVEQLVREAFWNHFVPGCGEHFVLHNLRKNSDFIPKLDFVAEKESRIVGQICYSRGIIKSEQGEAKEVISFGPVSVLPDLQKHGIASALIKHTISLARDMGYPAICIYGDPRYYSRFGFRCAEKYDIKSSDGKFAVALLALELRPGALNDISGNFCESAAFSVDEDEFAKFEATFPFKEKKETDSQREFMLMVSLRY
jgi:putative acetyltransferase